MTDEPDDLAELLGPVPAAPDPAQTAALLALGDRHLWHIRWARRAGRTAATVALLAVGVGVGRWSAPARERTVVVREPAPAAEVVAVPVVVPVLVPTTEPASAPAPVPPLSAARLELAAEQADGPRAAQLYRDAGDAYLTAQQDYANAARCYRLFLARAGDTALALEPGDSWLLTSLKNLAFKEKTYATANRR